MVFVAAPFSVTNYFRALMSSSLEHFWPDKDLKFPPVTKR